MASPSSAITPLGKHDVFLSFRGGDTRNNFISHLHEALCRKNIGTFIDEDLSGGEKLDPGLYKKIEDSNISIVIFSKNYADSTFCLRELVKILECREKKGQMVLPVFYKVNPADVQQLRGSFAVALARHEQEYCSEDVRRWRHALKEIANLKGWDSTMSKRETKLIDEIVGDIQKKLEQMVSPSTSKGFFGIRSRAKEVESLLCIGSPGVHVVGILGMAGIGKTTIAEAVFNQISTYFEGQCFLPNVREQSEKRGLAHLRVEILSKVLQKENLNIGMLNMIPTDIKRMLQRKKVLIVLDDVSRPQDLKDLIGEDGLLGQGSRIIVTSRDKQVLRNGNAEIYEIKELGYDDALQLFSLHAFQQSRCTEEYMRLSKRVVNYAKGIPLALKVLGSNLFGKCIKEWKSFLAKLEETLDMDIQQILRMSYDGLDWAEKSIFLDIACFFGRRNKDLVQKTLDLYGFYSEYGISRLVDKCLINVSNNEIWMHDLLQQLGRNIVFQENINDPGKRSRLWDPEDIYQVLTHQRGTETIEAIYLEVTKVKEINLSPTVFEGMHNLRLLEFYDSLSCESKIHFPGGLTFLSNKLRFLSWDDYPLKSLPSKFLPENLVGLRMPYSHLEQLWNEFPRLTNLKLMDLSFPRNYLIRTNLELSKVPNLEVLNLSGCNLVGILDFSEVPNLEVLDLSWCSSLVELPSSVKYCTKLTKLVLSYCERLQILPSSIGNLSQLVTLDLRSCPSLDSLPGSIGQLKSLKELDLSYCPKLSSLPNSIYNLESLVTLDLVGCRNLNPLHQSFVRQLKIQDLEREPSGQERKGLTGLQDTAQNGSQDPLTASCEMGMELGLKSSAGVASRLSSRTR